MRLNILSFPSVRMKSCFLALSLACAAAAFAEPSTDPRDSAGCQAEEASLQQDIALARSRGQMLRRRQLADALAALRKHCENLPPITDRATLIRRQDQEVQLLRAELERAEAYLRKLKAEGP
jgi:hypothetical protein